MMKRSLLVSAVAAALGLAAVGCNPQAGGIVASAPGNVSKFHGRIPATGQYILFRVNSVDATTGAPTSVTQVGKYDLQEGEHVGFELVPDEQTVNAPDGHMDVVAYAGTMRKNLGPVKTLPEHYYWATKDGFDHYWSVQPAYGFYSRVTLQQ